MCEAYLLRPLISGSLTRKNQKCLNHGKALAMKNSQKARRLGYKMFNLKKLSPHWLHGRLPHPAGTTFHRALDVLSMIQESESFATSADSIANNGLPSLFKEIWPNATGFCHIIKHSYFRTMNGSLHYITAFIVLH